MKKRCLFVKNPRDLIRAVWALVGMAERGSRGQHPLQPPLCPPKLIKDLWGKNKRFTEGITILSWDFAGVFAG